MNIRLKRWRDYALNSMGLDVLPRTDGQRLSHRFLAEKYLLALQELEALLRSTTLPDLPADTRGKRHAWLIQLLGTNPSEAFYLLNELHRCLQHEGAVCEFGVAQGATSTLLAYEILPTHHALWLFDSFEGLPAPSDKDQLLHDIYNLKEIGAYKGTMKSPIELVKRRLSAVSFPEERTHIVAGFIEDSLVRPDAVLPQRVCFAYVDLDFYGPIKTALAWLHTVTNAGSAIMIDDYGFFSSGAQTAVEEFMANYPHDYQISFPLKGAGHFCILRRQTNGAN